MTTTMLQETGRVEFTFEWYGRFLDALLDHGYDPAGFESDVADGSLLVRHDVDLSPRKALRMGRIEAERGIESTYFFLVTNPLYNVFDASCRPVLQELVSLGHAVGVHFSTHQYWQTPPSRSALARRLEGERTALEAVVGPISDAASFHCPPDWVINERFEGVISTYEPRFFSEIGYIADSGQRWRREPPLPDDPPESLQVLTHPGLWGSNDSPYTECVASEVSSHLEYTERFLTNQLLYGRFEPPLRRHPSNERESSDSKEISPR